MKSNTIDTIILIITSIMSVFSFCCLVGGEFSTPVIGILFILFFVSSFVGVFILKRIERRNR